MGVVAALAALRAAGLPVHRGDRPADGLEPRRRRADAARRRRRRERRGRAGSRRRRRFAIEYVDAEPVRAANAARLRAVAARIVAEIPGATLARDSAGPGHRHRDRPRRVRAPRRRRGSPQVVALMQREGMNATVSSIHVNGWFGAHSKLSGASWIVAAPARPRPRRRARRLALRRRLDQRRADVRQLSALGRRRQPARLRRPAEAVAGLRDRARPRPRLRRGRRGAARRARRMMRARGRCRRSSSPPRSPSAPRSRSAWRASPTRCCCRRCAPTSAGAISPPAR